jgi:probable H4MPT-linked C1 transfer pathway protein
MDLLAFDIGGANIKAADGSGYVASYPFPLWRESGQLSEQLRRVIASAPPAKQLLVTMTGELADCFANKAQGVQHILAAVAEAAEGCSTHVYLCDGRFVTPQEAAAVPLLAAASNWHALANYCGRFAPRGTALLVDIGSTTCDIIPLVDGRTAATGFTDTTRLLAGELVYTGVERSPVCALVRQVPYRGHSCGVAQEWFATSLDVYLLLEQIAERPHDTGTADGRPATKGGARVRLGRMIAADTEEFNHRDAVLIARATANSQAQMIVQGIKKVGGRLAAPPGAYIFSGAGEFLATTLLEHLPPPQQTTSLAEVLGPALSRCAPAHAVAVLAREAWQL